MQKYIITRSISCFHHMYKVVHCFSHDLSLCYGHSNSQLTKSQRLHSHFRLNLYVILRRYLRKLNWSEHTLNLQSELCYNHGQSCYEASIWVPWAEFYYYQTVAGLLTWGTLSDERIEMLPLSKSHRAYDHILLSQMWDPDLEGQVHIFITPRPWVNLTSFKPSPVEVEVMSRLTVSWPVCLGCCAPILSPWPNFCFLFDTAGFLMWGTPSDERMGL
jgi:hypothetical protein